MMNDFDSKKKLIAVASILGIFLACLILFSMSTKADDTSAYHITDIATADATRYSLAMAGDPDYETGSGEEDNEEVIEVTEEELQQNSEKVNEYSTGTHQSTRLSTSSADIALITLPDSETWDLLTGGRFSEYPTDKYYVVKQKVLETRAAKTARVTVNVWFWEDPNDDTNFNKVTKEKTWEVNEELVDIFKHVFEDIYNDPSKPVINLNDKGMGTWVTRGKMHSDYRTASAHAFGAAIDINPSTGTFALNGIRYGNAYKNHKMPTDMWEALPECHNKYHVLYEDSPIVTTFKAYGFIWGGDWTSGTDPMHFSFIGDGQNAREKGRSNFEQYNDQRSTTD